MRGDKRISAWHVFTFIVVVVAAWAVGNPRRAIAAPAKKCPDCDEARQLATELTVSVDKNPKKRDGADEKTPAPPGSNDASARKGDAPAAKKGATKPRGGAPQQDESDPMSSKFKRLREIFSKKAALCPSVATNKPSSCEADPDSASCRSCQELDLVRAALVKGTFGFLGRLKLQGFQKPLVIVRASDAINAAFVVDPKNKAQVARIVADLTSSIAGDNVDPQLLVGAVRMVADPAVLKHLRDRVEAGGTAVPPALKEATGENGSAQAFVEAYLGLELVWQTRVARWLEEADPNYRHKLYGYIRNAKALRIVVKLPLDVSAAAIRAEEEMVNSLIQALTARTAEGPYVPTRVEDAKWDQGRKEARDLCKKEGCDVVLELCGDVGGATPGTPSRCLWTGPIDGASVPELRVSAKLTFTDDVAIEADTRATAADTPPLEVRIPLIQRGPEDPRLFSDALDASNTLMTRLGSRIEIIGEAQEMAKHPTIAIGRPVRAGVSVYRKPSCFSAQRQKDLRGAGLQIAGSCGAAFDLGFQRVAAALEDPLGKLIGTGEAKESALTLSLAPNLASSGSCEGKVTGDAAKPPLFTFVTVLSENTPSKNEDAGADAASRLAEVYVGASCESPGSQQDVEHRPLPPLPPAPSPYHRLQALALSGLPWLTDGDGARHTHWPLAVSIADATFLIAGVASIGYSTRLRDQYASGEIASLGSANTFRNVGLALGGAVLVGRIVALAIYRHDTTEATATARPNQTRAHKVSFDAGGVKVPF